MFVAVGLLLAQRAYCDLVGEFGMSVKDLMRDDVCAAGEGHDECSVDLRQLRGEQQFGESVVAMSPSQLLSVMPPMDDMAPAVAWGRMQSMKDWSGRFDFAVKIRHIPSRSWCSGTLLKDRVLTAAHCVFSPGGVLRSAADFLVDSINAAGNMVVTTRVKSFRKHPRYKNIEGHHDFDFAILRLSAVVPTRVPIRLRSTPTPNGQKLSIAGFGKTARHDPNPEAPPLPVLSPKMTVHDCSADIAKDSRKVECLSSPPKQKSSSCGGDSGGGWFSREGKTTVIAGVNSAGYGGDCGERSKKTVMGPTSVAKSWIERVAPDFEWTCAGAAGASRPERGVRSRGAPPRVP
jgi:secreted trypsin-like serine protease